MAYAGPHLELFDLIRDQLRIAGAVAPPFDIAVGAVDAFVHASALGLNRNRGAVTLITREVDPTMKRGSGKGIEIRILAGWGEHYGSRSVTHEARQRFDGLSRRQRVDERDARPLPVTRHGIVDGQI